jgi:hypothetical protein
MGLLLPPKERARSMTRPFLLAVGSPVRTLKVPLRAKEKPKNSTLAAAEMLNVPAARVTSKTPVILKLELAPSLTRQLPVAPVSM